MIKFKEEICEDCDGHGVHYYEVKKFFGLIKNEVAYTCTSCNGMGNVSGEPYCPICEGAGLIGNERELCRTCNGTRTGDEFRKVLRKDLVQGNTFLRKCEKCKAETLHEFLAGIESKVITTTWEVNEWERSKETFERIKIECTMCGENYRAPLDQYYHSEKGFEPEEDVVKEEGEKKLFGQDFSSPSELFK